MKSIEYVNQKMMEALDEYEAAVALVDSDPEAHARVAVALMRLCDYSELYGFGEMPLSIMIRYHGVVINEMKKEFEEELEII